MKPNPLLQCFVLRAFRRFNRWFAALGAFPITGWVVGMLLGTNRTGPPGDGEEGTPETETVESILDSAGWAITGIGDAVSWLFWYAVLILPVFGVLWILLLTMPALRLKWLQRRYGIGVNRNGDAIYLAPTEANVADSGRWPPQ